VNDESTPRRDSRPPGRRRLRSGVTLLAGIATTGASALGFLALNPGVSGAQTTTSSSASNLGYTPISPARVCDTRTASASGVTLASGVSGQCDQSGNALTEGSVLEVAMPSSVVPSNASAVVVNVTAIDPSAPGYVSVYPATGSAPGLISNLDVTKGQIVANQATVALQGGAIDVYYGGAPSGSTVNIAVDVEGYYTSTSGDPYTAITPTRVCDTRSGLNDVASGVSGQCANSGTAVGPAGTLSLSFPSSVVPSGATAVALNVTEADATANSYVTAFPAGETMPGVSNLNFGPGDVLSNQVIVKLGSNGQVSLYNNSGNVDLIVDVDGYYTAPGTSGSLFTAMTTPERICDTRANQNDVASSVTGQCANSGTAVSGGSSVTVATGLPSGATAADVNVTDLPTTGNYLTAYAAGSTVPGVSTVNYVTADPYNIVPNAAYVPLSSSGSLAVENGPATAGAANVVVDLFGYFAPAVAVSGTTVTASPSLIEANGTATSTITVTVEHDGSPVPSDEVSLSVSPSTCGDFTAVNGTTITATQTTASSTEPSTSTTPGVLTATYTSSTTVENCTITATEADYGTSGTVTVQQAANNSVTLSVAAGATGTLGTTSTSQNGSPANPYEVTESAGPTLATYTVTATVTNVSGSDVANDTLDFAATPNSSGGCGTLSATSATTNSSGQASVTYTAPYTTGFCTITATEATAQTGESGPQSGSAVLDDIASTAPATAPKVTITPATSSVQANGTATDTLTISVEEGTSPVPNDQVLVSLPSPLPAYCGTLSASDVTTNSSGQATVTYTSSTTASTTPCTITAVEALEAESGNTSINQTAYDSAVVTASPASIPANGTSTSTITVTVTSPTGAPVANLPVGFQTENPSPSGACGTLSATGGVTNANGQASVTYTSSTTEGFCTVTVSNSNFNSSTVTPATVDQTQP
jgi:hypothetical protein